jgi:hypothetical protein
MIENRWQNIIPILEEFQGMLSPNFPKLSIVHANDKTWSDEQYKNQCQTGIFNHCGVYMIFDESEALEYVGVTTRCFHDRIWSHDQWVSRRFTDVIPFPDNAYFFAPALEHLLIFRLCPPKNILCKSQ